MFFPLSASHSFIYLWIIIPTSSYIHIHIYMCVCISLYVHVYVCVTLHAQCFKWFQWISALLCLLMIKNRFFVCVINSFFFLFLFFFKVFFLKCLYWILLWYVHLFPLMGSVCTCFFVYKHHGFFIWVRKNVSLMSIWSWNECSYWFDGCKVWCGFIFMLGNVHVCNNEIIPDNETRVEGSNSWEIELLEEIFHFWIFSNVEVKNDVVW